MYLFVWYDSKVNSDYFTARHEGIWLYNGKRMCSVSGGNWTYTRGTSAPRWSSLTTMEQAWKHRRGSTGFVLFFL